MNKTIFITGATAGIGQAISERMAKDGCRLIITGRRAERLNQLAQDLKSCYGVEVLPLVFDVRSRDEVSRTLSAIPQEWRDIDVLINNAGLASGLGSVQEGDIDDWEKMIDTNLKGLLYVSRSILPMMVARSCGHVINIGSIAGRQTYMNGSVYCATKFAVSSLTDGMRMDLNGTGVKVSQIQPGAVNTEFSLVRFHGDQSRADKVYEGFDPLMASDIADAAHYMISAPDHVNIAEMLILPKAQAAATQIDRRR
ncbi:MAG: SDR family NAD(P)-dependent oxidoreductase [Bacteroidales bacterium]